MKDGSFLNVMVILPVQKINRKMKIFSLLPFFALFTLATARTHFYHNGQLVGRACKTALFRTATFCPKETANSYTCHCSNIDAMGSYLYCGYENSHGESTISGFENWFLAQCTNSTVEEMRQVYANVSNYIVDVSTIPNFNKSVPVHVPVRYKNKIYSVALRSGKAFYGNFGDSVYMGAGLMGYWAVIILCGAIVNFTSKFAPNLLLSTNKRLGNSSFVRLYRKYVSIPATFRFSHTNNVFLGGLLPTRLESLIILGYFALNVAFECARIYYVANNTIFSSRVTQLSRIIGDRSGIISLFLMCLTFLLGGRNNFLIWLTGWKQSTFMTYHKWIARILVIVVVLHSIAMLIYAVYNNRLSRWLLLDWYRWGCVATVAGAIIFIQAISWLRVNYYETFLYIHILMALFFFVGTWRHVERFGYVSWCHTTMAIWCFDRFARFVRVLSFGFRTAEMSILSNETLQIVVPKHNWWSTFPGAFGYVYFMGSSLFWQSHPFTFVDTDDEHIKFYIKIKNGATKSIYKYLMTQPNYSCKMKIAVEGPYGDHKPVATYDQVLLYSGGNGIPGPYSYAKDLCQAKEKSKVQFTKFYWIIRHWYSLDWFLEELKSLQSYDKLQTIVYVTKYEEGKVGDKFAVDSSASNSSVDGEKRSDDIKESSESWLEPIQAALPHVEFRQGRPNIEQIVVEDLAEIQGSNVAVMTCGHPVMCDEIRKVVADQVGECKSGRIDLIEELQVW